MYLNVPSLILLKTQQSDINEMKSERKTKYTRLSTMVNKLRVAGKELGGGMG